MVTLEHTEFIRRYLMHVLPCGFQKIRYYGFLNNQMRHKNLRVIFKLQNGRRFKQLFAGMSMAELLKAIWNFDICLCPVCGHPPNETAWKTLCRDFSSQLAIRFCFKLPEKDTIPIRSRLKFRALAQLERITFRAALSFV